MIVTWDEAIKNYRYPAKDADTYVEGFKSGWFNNYLGHDSMIARTLQWGLYAVGYIDGFNAYYRYNEPEIVVTEGDIVCLKSLLG